MSSIVKLLQTPPLPYFVDIINGQPLNGWSSCLICCIMN